LPPSLVSPNLKNSKPKVLKKLTQNCFKDLTFLQLSLKGNQHNTKIVAHNVIELGMLDKWRIRNLQCWLK